MARASVRSVSVTVFGTVRPRDWRALEPIHSLQHVVEVGVEPELALEHANQRFIARFQHMETSAAGANQKLEDLRPEALEKLWESAKSSL